MTLPRSGKHAESLREFQDVMRRRPDPETARTVRDVDPGSGRTGYAQLAGVNPLPK